MSHRLRRQETRDEDSSPPPPPHSRASAPQLAMTLTSSGCDVVKRGSLHFKRFPSKRSVRISIKTWQKKYLVLRDDWKDTGKTTLDIYDRESDATPSDDNKTQQSSHFFASHPLSIDLRTVVNVDLYLESRTFVHALVIDRSDGDPIILGAQSDLEMKCWLAAIKLLADKASQLAPRIHRPPSCPSHLANDVKKPLKGSLSLMAKLNRSTPQLFKLARGRPTRHLSIDQELTTNASKQTSGNYMDVVVGDSAPSSAPRTPILSDSNSSTRKNSKTLTTNFSNHKETASKWQVFSKTNRKDSGFSESFDESLEQFQSNYSPRQWTVEEEDDCGGGDDYINHHQPSSSSPPPVPPRQLSSPFPSSPRTPLFHEPWFEMGPPRPPPRPMHTLSLDSY